MTLLYVRGNDVEDASRRLEKAGISNFSIRTSDDRMTISIADQEHQAFENTLGSGTTTESLKKGKLLFPAAVMKGDSCTIFVDTPLQTKEGTTWTAPAGEKITFIAREGGPRPGSWTIACQGKQMDISYDELQKLLIE